eukprot:NODE_532_length_7089_cov_0.272103.p2 type:complete len:245 gc:universal NODE_532_length_7089_cov_0.272103:134-868(+)
MSHMLSHFLLATLTKMTIAYHGKIKNFSSLAIADFNEVANIDKEMLPVKTYEELLKSENKYCFLAVQNSNHTLSQIYKMIMEYHWNVVGEYYWNTPLSLVGTGTEERKIKHVVVVGHIAGVCREYLDNKKLHIINVEDTAEACEYLKNTPDEAYAAIVPRVTALHYNLNILSSRVDDPDTLTRFFLVSKSNTKLNGSQPFKTTLVVRLPNRTGILHKVINFNLDCWMFCDKRSQHLSNRVLSNY